MPQLFRYLHAQKDGFLQGASVLVFYWMLAAGTLFVFGALIFYAALYRCCFIWPLGVIYLAWIYVVDLKTFSRGGRRVEFIRNNIFFKYMRDYYPVSLLKTAELVPTRNNIFCYNVGRFAYGSFRLPSVRLRLGSIRLRLIWQFAYVLSAFAHYDNH